MNDPLMADIVAKLRSWGFHEAATALEEYPIAKQPDCSICGRPSPIGNMCDACNALNVGGYVLETVVASGVKEFKSPFTWHFYSGYKTAQRNILAERMRNFRDDRAGEAAGL